MNDMTAIVAADALPALPALPPKVAAAICAVMGEVPMLGKGEKNSHGNYNFASIDDFLEAVRPLCAKHGLIIIQDEESFEMKEGWLIMTFRFTLAHASGETWGYRPTRTIMVSSKMGSQAFGAAQSYALKQFERSLFQIATGEKGNDADEHPAADLPTEPKKAQPRTVQKDAPEPAPNSTDKGQAGTDRAIKYTDDLIDGLTAPEDLDAATNILKAQGVTNIDGDEWTIKDKSALQRLRDAYPDQFSRVAATYSSLTAKDIAA